MSEPDHILGLVDDLVRLLADSLATTIEVEADGFSVTVTRRGDAMVLSGAPAAMRERPGASVDAASMAPRTQRVHAGSVVLR